MDTVVQSRSKTVVIGPEQPFCVIGERINPTGRKAFQAQLQAGDLSQLETADRHGDAVPEAKVERLKSKIEKLKEEIVRLNAINAEMMKSEDKQLSLTDPDARSMATSGKDTGIVGYNVQIAVDTQHHLIVAHEVTNVGTDRHQLANMAEQARDELAVARISAL